MFTVKWSAMPETLMHKYLMKGRRPTKYWRRIMIERVVVDVRTFVPNAERAIFKRTGEDMVRKFTKSLEDRTGKKGLGTAKRLIHKLQTKFDNDRRGSQRTVREQEAPNIPEAYGCIRWRVAGELPDTEESLDRKAEEMRRMFREQRRSEWDWKKIYELLEVTYALQRRDINSQTEKKRRANRKKKTPSSPNNAPKTTSDIKQAWPFLFQMKGVAKHFQLLTGVDVLAKMVEYLTEALNTQLDFFAKTTTAGHQNILRQMKRAIDRKTCKTPKLIAIILLVIHEFKESVNEIVLCVDETTPMGEVEDACALPPTPCIVAAGNSPFKANKFYFAVDGLVRSAVATFAEALCLLICSYFILNIKYPEHASGTMDIIQRVIVEINPVSGTENFSNKSTCNGVSNALLTLNDEYAIDVDSLNESEDDTDDVPQSDNEESTVHMETDDDSTDEIDSPHSDFVVSDDPSS